MSRIAFVDSKRGTLADVHVLLREQDITVETFGNGRFALDAFQRRMPDLIVISPTAIEVDGVSLVSRIRETSIVPIVVLSAANDEIDEIVNLRCGADYYICLPVSPRLLMERIKGLLCRHAMILAHLKASTVCEKTLVCGDLTIDPSRHSLSWKGRDVNLTVTEFQLLYALVRRPGMVKSRDQLWSDACPDEIYDDARSIDSHIKRIRKKLKVVDPDFSGVETLYGVGYRFSQSQDGANVSAAQRRPETLYHAA